MQDSTILPKTAVLLARQSRTDDGSMSVPDQFTMMEDYCERHGLVVAARLAEPDVSGRKPLAKRKGLKQAVAMIEGGEADTLLTAYFDRFVRSVATRAEVVQRVEAKGGSVLTMDLGKTSNATAAEKLSGTLLAAIAEFYADQVGEKTATSKQRNIDNGIPPFPRITPAYRRREDGRLEPHPTNGPLVRQAVEMRLAAQPASYTQLARWLTERGVRNEKGEPMTPTSVESMLGSKLLVGEIHFGSFRPNLHAVEEPILDHATFRRLQATRASRGRYGKSPHLLSRLGVLRCGKCDARMTSAKMGQPGRKYSYYLCGNPLCEHRALVSCDVADEYAKTETIKLGAGVKGRANAQASVEEARVAVETLNARLAKAIRTLAAFGGEEATEETLRELQAARDAADVHYKRLQTRHAPGRTVTTEADWEKLTHEERRDAICAVISRIVVAPGRGPDRLRREAFTL